jgi:hypothetical protein
MNTETLLSTSMSVWEILTGGAKAMLLSLVLLCSLPVCLPAVSWPTKQKLRLRIDYFSYFTSYYTASFFIPWRDFLGLHLLSSPICMRHIMLGKVISTWTCGDAIKNTVRSADRIGV